MDLSNINHTHLLSNISKSFQLKTVLMWLIMRRSGSCTFYSGYPLVFALVLRKRIGTNVKIINKWKYSVYYVSVENNTLLWRTFISVTPAYKYIVVDKNSWSKISAEFCIIVRDFIQCIRASNRFTL